MLYLAVLRVAVGDAVYDLHVITVDCTIVVTEYNPWTWVCLSRMLGEGLGVRLKPSLLSAQIDLNPEIAIPL